MEANECLLETGELFLGAFEGQTEKQQQTAAEEGHQRPGPRVGE